jgi:hypothetical protein
MILAYLPNSSQLGSIIHVFFDIKYTFGVYIDFSKKSNILFFNKTKIKALKLCYSTLLLFY